MNPMHVAEVVASAMECHRHLDGEAACLGDPGEIGTKVTAVDNRNLDDGDARSIGGRVGMHQLAQSIDERLISDFAGIIVHGSYGVGRNKLYDAVDVGIGESRAEAVHPPIDARVDDVTELDPNGGITVG